MAKYELNFDIVDEVVFHCQRNATIVVDFTPCDDETIDPTGKIVVGRSYNSPSLKTYTIGQGVELIGNKIRWTFNSNDFGNTDCIFDFSFIRKPNNQRDFKGLIKVNQSFM